MNTTSAGNVENCKNGNCMNMVSGEACEDGNLCIHMDIVSSGCFVMCAGKRPPFDGSKQLLFSSRRHSRVKPYDKSYVPLSLLYTLARHVFHHELVRGSGGHRSDPRLWARYGISKVHVRAGWMQFLLPWMP